MRRLLDNGLRRRRNSCNGWGRLCRNHLRPPLDSHAGSSVFDLDIGHSRRADQLDQFTDLLELEHEFHLR
jgi:hypothetical protein